MPDFQEMTKQFQEQNKCQVHIGYTDLAQDVEGIQNLLKLRDVHGILLQVLDRKGEGSQIYRPTTPLEAKGDLMKTISKFLMIAAMSQGKVTLVALKNGKDVPKKVCDFENVCQALIQKSCVLEIGCP